jgi:arylsulfatase A-like enzyme/Flp pilus assembly protein TadD
MTRARAAAPAAALALALLTATACGRKDAAAPRPLNVLLITIDTLRADHLGCYGDHEARTPEIDRLAAGGVVFENAVTVVPVTLPSHASIMTGAYPASHGVHNNGSYRLGDGATTLAGILHERGYRTAAVVAGYPLAARFGLAQGFDSYDDRLPPERERQIGYREKPAADVSRAGLEFLDRTAGGSSAAGGQASPFLLWLHFFDPHAPYAPPEPYVSQFAGRPYDGEIAYVDAEVGRVLERVRRPDLAANTLVVLMSDHGEGLGEHGEWTHGVFLYDSTLRVPLLMSLPGTLPAGWRIGALARSIDVLPTVLGELHVPVPATVQGESLLPLIEEGGSANGTVSNGMAGVHRDAADRIALAETDVPQENYGWSALRSIREGPLKFIRAPRPELYDLATDARETHDRSAESAPDAARLAADLDSRFAAAAAAAGAASPPGERQEPDEQTRENLQSLGYVFSPGPAPGRALADPKDRIAVLNRLDEGRTLIVQGRFDEAADTLTRALQNDPGNPTILFQRGRALLAAGHADRAGEDFSAVLALNPRNPDALQNLGSVRLAKGDLDEAAALFQQILDAAPDSPKALTSLGIARVRQGRFADAKPLLEHALALEPDSETAKERLAAVNEKLSAPSGPGATASPGTPSGPATPPPAAGGALAQARSLYAAGRFADIVTLAQDEIRAGRDTPEIRFALASALFQLKRDAAAAAEYKRVLAVKPDDARALAGLALIALRQGRSQDAMTYLEQSKRADPSNPDVQRNLGILYDEAGRTREAIACYLAALDLAPKALDLRFFLGRAYARVGRREDARAQFDTYLKSGAGEYRDAARAALADLGG